MSLTQKKARELFDYDDGCLIWKTRVANRVHIGDIAGSLTSRGYLKTEIGGKKYLNHRLVFLWHYGYLPEYGLDHIDRDPLNNRISNLREVSQTCNIRNTGNRLDNISGVKGVCWNKQSGKWNARITVNKHSYNLGYHHDFIEAVVSRLAAEQCLGWEGCDLSSPAFKFTCRYLEKQ